MKFIGLYGTLWSQYSDLVKAERAQILEKFWQTTIDWNKHIAAGEEKEDEEKPKSYMVIVTDACLPKIGAGESPNSARVLINYELPTKKVEALAVRLTQKEGDLIQEKFEVKKLLNFLKQASEDAKKLVSQERSFACAEIDSARAVALRIEEALEEQERVCQTSGKQETESLMEEVQEARRIKLLHQPSKLVCSHICVPEEI